MECLPRHASLDRMIYDPRNITKLHRVLEETKSRVCYRREGDTVRQKNLSAVPLPLLN